LWLEMKLPDSDARKRILESQLRGITAELSNCDVTSVISATENFTGADIKRLVEDAKGLYAFGRASQAQVRNSTEYFLQAASGVRENKQHYAQAELAAQRRPRLGRESVFESSNLSAGTNFFAIPSGRLHSRLRSGPAGERVVVCLSNPSPLYSSSSGCGMP